MKAADLLAELRAAEDRLTVSHLKALERFGVGRDRLVRRYLPGCGFGVVNATDGGSGLYVPGEGEPHLVLPVYEDGELIDLCAFRSADPARWLLRTGQAWALGLENGLERHAWGDATPVAVTPLEWLVGGERGLVVLDWDAPEVRFLRDLPHLACSTQPLAQHLRSALTQPPRLPTISVQEPMRYAA